MAVARILVVRSGGFGRTRTLHSRGVRLDGLEVKMGEDQRHGIEDAHAVIFREPDLTLGG